MTSYQGTENPVLESKLDVVVELRKVLIKMHPMIFFGYFCLFCNFIFLSCLGWLAPVSIYEIEVTLFYQQMPNTNPNHKTNPKNDVKSV